MQQELEALAKKHESLELDSKIRESALTEALESVRSARAEAHKALQEIDAVKKIASGKAFIMQSKHVKETFLFLTLVRSSPGAFVDLPRSVLDVAEFYRAKEASSMEKLFWSQYTRTEHPMPLSDQLKQLVELHKAAEQAMKGLIVRMWPGDPLPDSYFGLVRQLVNVCIEGARRAFAQAKVHCAKLDAEKLEKGGPPEGEGHRPPEMYYKVS